MKLGTLALAILVSLFAVSFAFAQETNLTNETTGNETDTTPISNTTNETDNSTTEAPINDTNQTQNDTITLPPEDNTTGNTTNDTLEDPGLLPSNPLWGVDVALDRLRYILTFDKTERARVGLEIAQERLSEILAAAERGDIKSIQKAQVKHDETLSKVKEHFNFTTSDNQSTEFKQIIEVGKEVEKYRLKVDSALRDIDVKIKVKGDLTPEQQAMIDSVLSQVQSSTEDMKVKIKVKDGKFEVKVKSGTDDAESESETEVEFEIEDFEEESENKGSGSSKEDRESTKDETDANTENEEDKNSNDEESSDNSDKGGSNPGKGSENSGKGKSDSKNDEDDSDSGNSGSGSGNNNEDEE